MRHKIVVIVGPTASGKSAYAVKLARKIGGEVISADSRQVYKALDIGTGKITKAEMKGVPHHLLDVASPKEVFTAQNFVDKGRTAIEDILKRGKTPIICGGTGFYIDALLGRVPLPNVPPNLALRKQLAKKNAAQLFALLKKLDARRAKGIDAKNPVRLIRAIEIARKLGKVPPLPKAANKGRSFVLQRTVLGKNSGKADIEWIGIIPDDKTLRRRIHKRLLVRMAGGMVREAKRLKTGGLSYKRMNELGLEYRYLALFLQKKISKKEMLEELEKRIRDYAKRQMTYWRRNGEILWRKR